MTGTNADPEVEADEELGTRLARFAPVDAGEAHVEVPNLETTSPTISVAGEALDDRPGGVVVQVRGGVSVSLSLSPPEARDLAETIARAADEAEADI